MLNLEKLDGFVETLFSNGSMIVVFETEAFASDSVIELEENGYFCSVDENNSCHVVCD